MNKTSILAIALAISASTYAQTTITPYTPGVSAEGVVYYLPKTYVDVSVTIEKSVYTPGELCQYADRFLRLGTISDKPHTFFTLKDARLTTGSMPDKKKVYHIKYASNSVAPLVTLSKDGVLQAINTSPIEPTQEAVAPTSTTEKKQQAINPRSFMTEEMLLAGSKAKLAELVAKEIYSIRESKNLIIRGQNENMPKEGEALTIILNGLQEQEEALMQLFTGSTTTESITETYQVIPEGNTEKTIIGRFSRKLGLLHQDDLAGAPIYISITSQQNIPEPAPEPAPTEVKKGKAKGKNKKKEDQDGLVYNIPCMADIKVFTNTQTLVEESLPFAQFGRTETLSVTLFTKKKDIKVTLDPITGALNKVEE